MRDNGGTSIKINTPEAVSFTYDTAGIGARFAATAFDSLILSAILATLTIAILIILSLLSMLQGREDYIGNLFSTAANLIISLSILLSFCVIWGYYILFERYSGGVSPGKKIAGLKVVKADGSPLLLPDIFIRNIIRIVDFIPSFYLVGVIALLFSKKKQRLGDLAAGTIVIHVRQTGYVGKRTPNEEIIFSGFCRVPLTPREFETVTRFLVRRLRLHPQRHAQLSARIAAALARKYDLPLERFSDAESMLLWLFTPDAPPQHEPRLSL